ncbi:hypothetical protein B0T14DRAFT_496459 [Immersiella caudata]|uniref:Uncharacterized protein n=1 Tax=Immersiella caudata TaxID=314043 RepID=A0AA39WQM7_9PEZI|nr:hypothetical protein B0T14DRAFT_496459 [Immersiella caudata]
MGVTGRTGTTGLVGQGPMGLNQGPGPVSSTALQPRTASRPASRQGSRHGPQNTVIPPVAFPEGRNPYLERPLPPPPPPKTPKSSAPVVPATVAIVAPPTATTMPLRPSTSSGPGTGSSSRAAAAPRPNFEKRLSKDDMSLTGQMGMSMGRTKGVQQPYRFGGGARSVGLPTPEDSPNLNAMPSPPPVMFVPSRVPTPNSLSSGEIQIGMALGSPTEYTPSPLAAWQPQQMTPPRDAYSPLPPQRTPEPPAQRQKTQKRKFFGALFGRGKHSEREKTPEPVSTPEPVKESYATSYAAISNLSLDKSGEATPLRANTVTAKKTPKFTLRARSRTEPDMEEAAQEAKKSVPEVKVMDPKPEPVQSAAPSLGSSGFLDIEIPDIRLERYSIMFSGVLNPQGSSTTPSLLARRQATLEKLKTINDRIVNEEMSKETGLVRRATSPHVKSPSFSLFPPPQLRPNGASPRMRSTSSPAMPSPARASFDIDRLPLPESRLRKESKRVTIISPRTMDERNRQENVEKLREQQIQMQKAQRAPSPFRPEDSTFFLDSPDSPSSVSDVEEILSPVDVVPLKPRLDEPRWEIVSPPSTSALSEASSTMTKRSMSSTSTMSSVKTSVTRPSLDMDDEEEDAGLKAAVEISIARQISISRQQRNLLRTTSSANPLPKNAPSAVSTARGASVKVPTGNGLAGRVIETKQSMPRLVDMHFGRNRKSERVVLEAM